MSDSGGWGDEEDTSPAAPQQKMSGLCIASLVLGLLGFLCCGPFTSIPGVICGHMGLGAVKQSNGQLTGKGLGIAGLVVSYLSLVLTVAYILFLFATGGWDEMMQEIEKAMNQ